MIPKFEKEEFKIENLSSIKYRIYEINSEDSFLRNVLIIQFDGACGFGSGSNQDCRYMESIIQSTKLLHRLSFGIILDFRNLSYEWGDEMSRTILAADCFQLDPVILVSDKCYNGLYSLVEEEMGAVPEEYLFWEEEKAIEYLREKYIFFKHVLSVINNEIKYSTDIHQVIKCDWDERLQLDKNRNKRAKLFSLLLFYRPLPVNLEFLTTIFKEECEFTKYTKDESNVNLFILTELVLTNGSIEELEFVCSEIFSIRSFYQPPSYTRLPLLLIHFVLNYLKRKIMNSNDKNELEKYTYCENIFLTFSKSSGVSIP